MIDRLLEDHQASLFFQEICQFFITDCPGKFLYAIESLDDAESQTVSVHILIRNKIGLRDKIKQQVAGKKIIDWHHIGSMSPEMLHELSS